MSNTGHFGATRSTCVRLSITRRSVMSPKLAVATELPATSWAQVTLAVGVTPSSKDRSDSSRVSRGAQGHAVLAQATGVR